MAVSYKKLWKLLIDKDMKKKDLCEKAGISPASVTKMGRNGHVTTEILATVYKGNIIKNLIMDCQSYTKYRPNETTGGIFVSWRGKEELPTGLD